MVKSNNLFSLFLEVQLEQREDKCVKTCTAGAQNRR